MANLTHDQIVDVLEAHQGHVYVDSPIENSIPRGLVYGDIQCYSCQKVLGNYIGGDEDFSSTAREVKRIFIIHQADEIQEADRLNSLAAYEAEARFLATAIHGPSGRISYLRE